MLVHVLGTPLIQHFSTACSKNTWHFRVSGAGPQNKNRARAFPLGHWDRGNPWTSVCEASGETGPVYFGRCLARDGHELNVRLRRAKSRLGQWQRKQLLRTRRPCRHGNPHGTVWWDGWDCSLALKIYGSGKRLFKRLSMTLSPSLSCTQEKMQTGRKRLREDRDGCFLCTSLCSLTHCGALLRLQTGEQEICCLHISQGSASCELPAVALIKSLLFRWAGWVFQVQTATAGNTANSEEPPSFPLLDGVSRQCD